MPVSLSISNHTDRADVRYGADYLRSAHGRKLPDMSPDTPSGRKRPEAEVTNFWNRTFGTSCLTAILEIVVDIGVSRFYEVFDEANYFFQFISLD